MSATATPSPRCNRCGRILRSATSIAAGYGRICKARVAAATVRVAKDFQPFQVVKAAELIEQAAIVRDGRTAFRAVSSRGNAVYLIDRAARACTCPAGEKGWACYHLAAADILAAA